MKHKDWIYLSRQIEKASSPEEAEKILEEICRLEATEVMDILHGHLDSTQPTNDR